MSDLRTDGASAARAARARELTTNASPTAELLGFYAALVEYQQRLVNATSSVVGRVRSDPPGFRTSGSLLQAIDATWVGLAARDLVRWLVDVAPPGLVASTDAVRDVAEEAWREFFESYRASPDDAAARCSEAALFALEAVLQPVAERLAAARLEGPGLLNRAPGATRPRCPACGDAPVVGVLREEGHGARRRLVCGLCLTEWDYLRVVCVRCGEQRFDQLPVFTADQFPQARVDACETCRGYLKTIDATRDGRAVPVVDDLATSALDLWAREQGYVRVRANLLRT